MNNPTMIFGLACKYVEKKYPTFSNAVHPLNQVQMEIRIYPNINEEGYYLVSGANPSKWYWRKNNNSSYFRLTPEQLRDLILLKRSGSNVTIQLKSKRYIFGTWTSWHDFFKDINMLAGAAAAAIAENNNQPEEIAMFDKFTVKEIELIIAAVNSLLLDDSWKTNAKEMLITEVIDYCVLNEMEAAQFGKPANLRKTLSGKISELSEDAAYKLVRRCKEFWGKEGVTLEKYSAGIRNGD